MDIDQEVRQRLRDTEDHFTERKESAQEQRIREVMVAFANSAIPDKPGMVFIGMTDKGVIKGVENPDTEGYLQLGEILFPATASHFTCTKCRGQERSRRCG